MTRTALLLPIIYLAFISLGLPDGVLGVAWPTLRAELHLPLATMGLISSVLLCLSAFSGLMSGRVLTRFGTGPVTAMSCLATALALAGYAAAPNLTILLLCTIPLGLGQGAVDSGLNLYVATHYGARHMNWLHCCWGVGASCGPTVMTTALVMAASLPIAGWRAGYTVIASAQLVLAAVLFISLRAGLWQRNAAAENTTSADLPQGHLASLPTQLAAAGLFFLYVGMETAVGVWLNTLLVEGRELSVAFSGLCVAAFFGSIMAGRFFSGVLVGRVGNNQLIRAGYILAFCGALAVWYCAQPALIMAGTVLLGLGCAPVYPGLMHETPRRFAAAVTPRLMGWQVSGAYVGGVCITSGMGLVMSRISLEALCPALLGLIALQLACNEWLLYKNRKARR